MKTRLTTQAVSLGIVLAAALSLSGCSILNDLVAPPEQRDEEGTIVDGGSTDIFTIAVGDCLVENVSEGAVSAVKTVPCDEPHAGEVFADYTMDEGEYPGEDAVFAKAEEECSAGFETFVGLSYEDSTLEFSYYYPVEDTWNEADDRLISCIIEDPANAELVGSLSGAGY